jgi:hypothetical protein
MNKLQKEAAKYGYFDAETMPAQYLQPQKTDSGFGVDYSELFKSSKAAYPDEVLKTFTSGLFFRCYEQKKNFADEVELYVMERPTMLYLTPEGRVVVLRHSKGKYDFFLLWDYRMKLTTRQAEQAEAIKAAGLLEPNKIGIFTRKKVESWLEYCDKVYSVIHEHNSETDKKNAEIRAGIMDFIHKTGGNFSEYNGNIYADCGPFRIAFEHDKASANLYTKIEYSGTLEQVSKFLSK